MARGVISANCETELLLRLERYAEESGESVSKIVNDLVAAFLEKAEQQQIVNTRVERAHEVAEKILKLRWGRGSRS